MNKFKLFRKFTEWEYWPIYMFYIPNLPYALYLAIKARNLTFYSVTNPSIRSSGNGTESKYKTLELIPEAYKPKSIFVSLTRDFDTIIMELHKSGIDYPIIAKPDVGFRGMLVEKIYSDFNLKKYLEAYPVNLILQEFIDLPNECGIFYHRLPNAKKGAISSLTLKSFLSVQGDGFSSLSELISYDNRAKHYTKLLEKDHKEKWNSILNKDEIILLSDIGNHCRGTQFINGNHLIDEELENTFDKLNVKIDGWFYGRVDVKYNTIEELKKGKNFIILEINGIISEPTHILDPTRITYLEALKSIRQHWRIVYDISEVNYKIGIPSKDFMSFWKEIKELLLYVKRIKRLSKINNN